MTTKTINIDDVKMLPSHRLFFVDCLDKYSNIPFFPRLARSLARNSYAAAIRHSCRILDYTDNTENLTIRDSEQLYVVLLKIAMFASDRAENARGTNLSAAAEAAARYCAEEYHKALIRLSDIFRKQEKKILDAGWKWDHAANLADYADILKSRAETFREYSRYMK